MGAHLQEIPRSIGFIDDTLIEIHKPKHNEAHCTLINGQKNLCNENTIILDHHGLFIYIEISYHGFYHNVSILQHFNFYNNWCQFFTHVDDYFEYLLGDSICMGEEMFIM